VLETELTKELARELRQVHKGAKKNIKSTQRSLKQCYDRGAKDVELQIGDLEM